jgi:hypothetical protein
MRKSDPKAMTEENYFENDFNLDRNKRFEKRIGVFRVIGMSIIFCGIAAALLGLFGYGWWTKQKAIMSSGSVIEYEKFLHAKKETELKVRYKGEHAGTFAVEIGAAYFEKLGVQKITPEPYSTVTGDQSITFYFKNTHGNGLVLFNTVGHSPGFLDLAVKINEDSVLIHQFIYP